MPELPEVETVRRGLIPVMQGRRIRLAEVRRPDLRWPFPDRMAERLTQAKVVSLGRRSKYILLHLDTQETLIVHLGMSGRMQIDQRLAGQFHDNPRLPEKHDHVIFEMESGTRIAFNDARRFGAMDLCATESIEQHRLIEHLGPEPFGNEFDETYLANRLGTRKSTIKTVLLDQKILAGLGNIYVCEVLFRVGICPLTPAQNLSPDKVARLVPAIRDVLREAIDAGGSSLRDHRQTNGDLGYFQHSFAVYDREGQPCQKEGCTTRITRITQSGRSSFYCPNCQR